LSACGPGAGTSAAVGCGAAALHAFEEAYGGFVASRRACLAQVSPPYGKAVGPLMRLFGRFLNSDQLGAYRGMRRRGSPNMFAL
jgi:hypothetical protein